VWRCLFNAFAGLRSAIAGNKEAERADDIGSAFAVAAGTRSGSHQLALERRASKRAIKAGDILRKRASSMRPDRVM
jgi:hypothetical protein